MNKCKSRARGEKYTVTLDLAVAVRTVDTSSEVLTKAKNALAAIDRLTVERVKEEHHQHYEFALHVVTLTLGKTAPFGLAFNAEWEEALDALHAIPGLVVSKWVR